MRVKLSQEKLHELEQLRDCASDIAELKRVWAIQLLKTSYYVIFRNSSFSYHKPGKEYQGRDEEEVVTWRKETEKMLKEAWADPDTVILAEDELILSTQTTFQKVWLPVNSYPKVAISHTRKVKAIFGFLNVKSGKEHAFSTNRINMFATKRMLQAIRRIYPKNSNKGNKLKGKKILLLWDNPGWHKGSAVTEYVKKDGKITLLYFPKYAPDQNPQEHVWKEGRSKVTHNRFIDDLDAATKDFVAYLNSTRFNYALLNFSPIS